MTQTVLYSGLVNKKKNWAAQITPSMTAATIVVRAPNPNGTN